ncbi:alkaline phosphatase family protein [Chryseobacterium luteum]|uniref:alkaline phosphatase family protein n=1 Tax=Chryseobacterium luteum TaxID=421531 RepID=UPI0021CDCFEF|nr:alkaline phosphatase family protein [Chryseobacterium luteum]
MMKRGIQILLLLFSLAICAQQANMDTAQVVVSGRTNSVEARTKPYVIMISADGFRYDYAKKYNAENLLKLAAGGVQAEAMIPSYPSITFPNQKTGA